MMPRIAASVLALAALGLAGWSHRPANSPQNDSSAVPAGEIGSRLPDFAVKGLGGRKISSAVLRGKVVLIDFWATWCEPCKKEMPGYERLLRRYGSRGFAVVGFKADMMRDAEDPLAFARRMGVTYPLAVGDAEIRKKFGGIQGLPTTFLYDRRGILRKKIIGFEYTAIVESSIKELLGPGSAP